MIKIFSFASNRPDFVALQMHSFQRHLCEDFEFTVFNNAPFDSTGGANYTGIHDSGRSVGAQVVDIRKDPDLVARCQQIELSCSLFSSAGLYSNANVAHAYALRWAWENLIVRERGPVAILDSDVFLVQPTKLTDTLYPHHICGVPDGRPHPDGALLYIWPTFVLLDMARLPEPETLNWWCGRIKGVPVDVAGQTYHYFQAHPELDVLRFHHAHFADDGTCPVRPADYDEFYLPDAVVLHYRSGSNWNHQSSDYHRIKTEWLRKKIG